MSYFKSAEEIYKEMTSTLGDVDTSENNSFIYNSNMPAAMELANALLNQDNILLKAFARLQLENGYSDYLDLRCLEMGIERKEATTARVLCTFTGSINTILPVGSVVGTLDNRLYVTEIEITIGEDGTATGYVLANESGAKYNVNAGEISYFPVKYNGITSVTNLEDYNEAYDKESNEALYDRYMLKIRTPATSGNKYHYEQWALEVTGVGSAKCIPGAGNVKVIIANSNKRAASEELIEETYNHIDEVRPLLAGTLFVVTVKEIAMNITANVEIDTSVILGDVQETFKKSIEDYFDNTVYSTKKISIAKLGALLMDIEGVVDYSNLKINNSTSNISLNEEEIAVVGTVTLGVI